MVTACATRQKTAALSLARRVQALEREIDELDVLIAGLVKQISPGLLNVYGVGVDVAAAILVAVGDNPERIPTEAAFAKLCGVAPLPANSGKRTNRHKLNPGGTVTRTAPCDTSCSPACHSASRAPLPISSGAVSKVSRTARSSAA